MSSEDESYIKSAETVYLSEGEKAISKIYCKDGHVLYLNSIGMFFEEIGNEFHEDEHGNILNERDEIVDLDDDLLFTYYGKWALEDKVKDIIENDTAYTLPCIFEAENEEAKEDS